MYKMYFSQAQRASGGILPDFSLPILPEKLKESGGKDNQKYDLLATGEAVRPGARKLKTWEIESIYENGQEMSIKDFCDYIKDMAESPEHFIFGINRFDADGNEIYSPAFRVVLESYSLEERAGEIGDIYYTLKLREYREHEGKMLG